MSRVERQFLDNAGPIAFAHRGGSGDAPENTMAAFEAAVALGYRYLETDVRLSGDGMVIAFHDSSLDRTTDSRGAIANLTLAQIREADAGHWFTQDGGLTFPFRGRGVTVSTLEELLTRWPGVRWNIDPKDDVVVGPLAALLHRMDALDRVCIGSFSDRRLLRIRALTRGHVCTSMGRNAVVMAWLSSLAGRMARVDADCVQIPHQWRDFGVVNGRFLRAAHSAGLPVHVWTINDESTMRELLDAGVDGIMTDRPSILRSILTERDGWSDGAA